MLSGAGIAARLKENELLFYIIFSVLLLSLAGGFIYSLRVQFLLLFVLLVSVSIQFSKRYIKNKAAAAVLLPLAAVFFSYIGADFQVNVRNVSVGLINAASAFFLMSYASRRSREKIFFTLPFLGLWVSFLLFIQFFTGDCEIERSFALNINILSGFLVLVYPAALALGEKNKYPLAFILIALMIVAAAALTRSRMGMFLVYLTTLFYFIRLKNRREFRILFAASSFLVVAGIVYAFFFKSGWNSLGERFVWWQTAWVMFKDNPFFGIGFGNYSALFSFYRTQPVLNTLFAHNMFIQILAETGISGAICFGAAFYAAAKSIFRSFKNKNGDPVYMRGALAGIVCFLIFNITEYSFYIPLCMMAFFVLCGFACGFETGEREKKAPYSLIVLPAAFVIYTVFWPALAENYYEKGKNYAAAKDFENARLRYLKAVKFDKKNPEYYHQAADSSFRLYILSGRKERSFLDDTINFELLSEKFYMHSAQIKAGLANLYNLKGDFDNAGKYARAAGEADKFNPNYGSLR